MAADLWVAVVTRLAGALGLVADSRALSVPATWRPLTHWLTLGLSNAVLLAGFSSVALVVRATPQLLDAEAVETVLQLWAGVVVLARRLAEGVDAHLLTHTVSGRHTD